MIVGEEGECVYLCDGRLRGVEHPKKKKKKHIQIIHSSAQDTLIQIIKQNLPGERDDLVFERRENHFERRVRARLRGRTFVRRFRKLFFCHVEPLSVLCSGMRRG